MKKIFLCIFLMIFCMFIQGKAEDNTDTSLKKITLNALLEEHPTVRVIAKLLPVFEMQTGIDVNIEVIPYEPMTEKVRQTLKQKSSYYDIYMDGWVHGIEWAAQGNLESLDEYIKNPESSPYIQLDDFIDAYLTDAQYQGKLYGLPVYGESTFFYYRKDIFAQYGIKIPNSMEDISAAAKIIKEKNKDIYAITLRGKEGIHLVYAWASFLWAFGGYWFNERGALDLYSPETIQATKFFVDLLQNYGPPAFDSFGWHENRDLFLNGKAAMSIDATVNGAFNENVKYSKVKDLVGYLPTPQYSKAKLKGGVTSLVTHQMYINKYSQQKKAAFQFISWATSQKVQIKSMEIEPNCGLTSKSAIESDVFQQQFGAFKESMLLSIQTGNSEYLPRIPQSIEIIAKIGNALTNILIGKETPEKALKKVTYEVNSQILFK